MTPDEEKKLYLTGIQLFNEHEFFEAHEVWEDVWHAAYGKKQKFYQGLIQCAVALEHYRRSNPRGVLGLSRRYPPKFREIPPVFLGLDVKGFLAEMARCLGPVIGAETLPAAGEIELDLATTPKIVLAYDPFENGEAERLRAG